jgi:hypothetical protein
MQKMARRKLSARLPRRCSISTSRSPSFISIPSPRPRSFRVPRRGTVLARCRVHIIWSSLRSLWPTRGTSRNRRVTQESRDSFLF